MSKRVRFYTLEEILKQYDKLPYKAKSDILFDAIDIALQYNGRSKGLCIAMAMGYENHEGANNTFFKEVKE